MCSEISFVCVFVIGVCTHVCSPVCGHLEARETSVSSFVLCLKFLRQGFLLNLELTTAGASRGSSISPVLGAQLPTTTASFSHAFWRLNPDPHACTPMRDFLTQLPSARLRGIKSLTTGHVGSKADILWLLI